MSAFTVTQAPHDYVDLACREWVLGLPLKASCRTRFDYGDGWRKAKRTPGDILIVPPGTEVRYEVAGDTKLLVLAWPRGAIQAIDPDLFADEAACFRSIVGFYFKNTSVDHICRSIWTEMARKEPVARLMSQTLLTQLALTLYRCSETQPKLRQFRRAEIRRSLEFIRDNLEREVTLKDLADASGLSMFHFAREFRTQIGTSPMRYIKEQRLQRVDELRAKGGMSMESLARQSGFRTAARLREALRSR
jgi:AraC family transcriptional regulator